MWPLWIFAFLDIYGALFLLLSHYDIVGLRLAFPACAYLLLKGFYFLGDVASFIDLLIALYFVCVLVGLSTPVLTWAGAFYLTQKAIVSMMS